MLRLLVHPDYNFLMFEPLMEKGLPPAFEPIGGQVGLRTTEVASFGAVNEKVSWIQEVGSDPEQLPWRVEATVEEIQNALGLKLYGVLEGDLTC